MIKLKRDSGWADRARAYKVILDDNIIGSIKNGEDVLEYLELTRARRIGQEQKRVNVDFPVWMIHSLDKEAKRLGMPRQSLIKVLIVQHIEHAGA